MIKEAYCSHEVSKLLKEKGFDEDCKRYYDPIILLTTLYYGMSFCKNSDMKENEVTAPTHLN